MAEGSATTGQTLCLLWLHLKLYSKLAVALHRLFRKVLVGIAALAALATCAQMRACVVSVISAVHQGASVNMISHTLQLLI